MAGKRQHPYMIEGSTDIGGVSPWLAMDIWSRYADIIDGLEVIAWRWSTSAFATTSNRIFPLTRFHGQLGGEGVGPIDSLKVSLYNHGLLLDDQPLFSLARTHKTGVLVHAPHAANGFASHLLKYDAKAFSSNSLPQRGISLNKGDGEKIAVWIENHTGGEAGLAEAVALARRFKNNGRQARLMIDLAHYLEPALTTGFRQRWQTLISTIGRAAKEFDIGIHFPVGDLEYDSINLLDENLITDQMLSVLRQSFSNVSTVVFEYQSPIKAYLTTPERRKKAVQARLDRILARLYKTGIV